MYSAAASCIFFRSILVFRKAAEKSVPVRINHEYSDGTVLKTVDCVEELRRKGIYTNAISVFGIEKTGKRKYKFSCES